MHQACVMNVELCYFETNDVKKPTRDNLGQ